MKLFVISFTHRGGELSQKICRYEKDCCCFTKKQGIADMIFIPSLRDWTEEAFQKAEGIVFIGACGIAVRAIAPFLQGKDKDPAIVVVDEKGQFVISLLSGHVGGGNQLAKHIAEKIGAIPVITTATDINGLFAVDVWAKEQCLFPFAEEKAIAKAYMKRISVWLLEGKSVGFYSTLPYGTLPKGLVEKQEGEFGIYVCETMEGKTPFTEALILFASVFCVGIGCRKGTSLEQIEKAVWTVLEKAKIPLEAVASFASITLKQQEQGLLSFCRKYQKNITFFSPEALQQAQGTFSHSDFVTQITGVDSVCERASVLGAKQGQLMIPKTILDGVTVAVAKEKKEITF